MLNYHGINIYENLGEILNPRHTALVVWDVQDVLVNRIPNKAEFLSNLKTLLESARNYEVPIIYAKTVLLPVDFQSSWRIYGWMKDFDVDTPEKLPDWLQPQAPVSEINSEISPKGKDVIIEKRAGSIFIGTHFEYMMRNRGINSIIFTGISTEIGVDSCARDSSNRGFYTIVVDDCISSPDRNMHALTLELMKKLFIVTSSQDIMNEWR